MRMRIFTLQLITIKWGLMKHLFYATMVAAAVLCPVAANAQSRYWWEPNTDFMDQLNKAGNAGAAPFVEQMRRNEPAVNCNTYYDYQTQSYKTYCR